jgi:hypothetical protein
MSIVNTSDAWPRRLGNGTVDERKFGAIVALELGD